MPVYLITIIADDFIAGDVTLHRVWIHRGERDGSKLSLPISKRQKTMSHGTCLNTWTTDS